MCCRVNKVALDTETGSQRLTFLLSDGSCVESAVVYHKSQVHLCVSTQVGCPLGCRHCATTYSNARLSRNLTAEELNSIIEHLLEAADGRRGPLILSYSGHGEPLLNWHTIAQITPQYRSVVNRIYVATVGIRAMLPLLLAQPFPDTLYVSLHGSSDAERQLLIPSQPPAMACKDIVAFIEQYLNAGRKVVINYVATFSNSDSKSATAIAHLFSSFSQTLEFRVFELNRIRDAELPCQASPDIMGFINELGEKCHTLNIRYSRPVGGTRCMACGQMQAHYEDTR